MIVTRLILHRRHLQKVIGAPDSSVGLYTAIVAMIIESYALYAVAYLLYIVPWALSSWLMFPFSKIVGQVQVRTILHFRHCFMLSSNRGYTYRSSLRI